MQRPAEAGENMSTILTPNNLSVIINGTDYSSRVPFPVKTSQLLDEQLDEGFIALLQVPVKIFPPLTNVTIVLSNSAQGTSLTFNMIVATDKAEETPPGSGLYNHEIYLIEETKYLEGFICRSHGYVNDLGRIYTTNAKYIEPTGTT